ncbi:MAG: hypothetical protein WD066_16480 [Planctomycetaceae bacterium]
MPAKPHNTSTAAIVQPNRRSAKLSRRIVTASSVNKAESMPDSPR